MIKRLKAIIIDNEPDSIFILKNMLEGHQNIDILAEAESGQKAIELIETLNPDLIFLDVEMPGLTGFEVLKAFDKPKFKVIFVTGFEKYAIQAIKYSAMDYIVKPVDQTELNLSILRVLTTVHMEDDRLSYFKSIHKSPDTIDRIIIASKNGFRTLLLSDILSIESQGSYAMFYLKSGQCYLSSKPLKHYEKLLAPHQFFRIHRSHLINVNEVVSYANKTGVVVLNHGKTLEVSVRKRSRFNEIIRKR